MAKLKKKEARDQFLSAISNLANKHFGTEERIFPVALNNNDVQSIISANYQYPIADVLTTFFRRRLQELSRNESINSPVVSGWLNVQISNIVSASCFTHKANVNIKAAQQKSKIDEIIDREWQRFTEKPITTTGQNLLGVCLEACRYWQNDGEVFARIITNPKPLKKIGAPFLIELLDCNRFGLSDSVGFGGSMAGAGMGTGNTYTYDLGIEYDDWGIPEFYNAHSGIVEEQKLKAAEMIHFFTRIFPEQKRGIPISVAALDTINNMRKFFDATLLAAQEGARTKGVVQTEMMEITDLMRAEIQSYSKLTTLEKEEFDDEDSIVDKSVMEKIIVGMTTAEAQKQVGEFDILRMQPGHKFTETQTQFPSPAMDSFVKAISNQTARGLGGNSAELMGNWETLTFSSGKLASQSSQDLYMIYQAEFINGFLMPIKREFIKVCLRDGLLGRGESLTKENVVKYSRCKFIGRRWEDLNALATVKKNLALLESGLISWQELLAELNRTPAEVIAEIKADVKKWEDAELNYPFPNVKKIADAAAAETATAAENSNMDNNGGIGAEGTKLNTPKK